MGRLSWLPATVAGVRDETATVRGLSLDVDGWEGHRPGQHVDVRLTAPDGYQAVRPYSIAAPADGRRVELTVALVDGGEVSTYLTRQMRVGTQVEVRGPLGRWFVWDGTEGAPVQMLGGGVGVVPLMAMLRQQDRLVDRHLMNLVYVVRRPSAVIFAAEIGRRHLTHDPASAVHVLYTREAADDAARPPGRLTASDIEAYALPPTARTRCYVCGPTGFVESAISLLVGAGFEEGSIRAERFGP